MSLDNATQNRTLEIRLYRDSPLNVTKEVNGDQAPISNSNNSTPKSHKHNTNLATEMTPMSVKLQRLPNNENEDDNVRNSEITPLVTRFREHKLTSTKRLAHHRNGITKPSPLSVKLQYENNKNHTELKSRKLFEKVNSPSTPKVYIEFSNELRNVINERNILTTKTKQRVFDALNEIKAVSTEESRRHKKENVLQEIIISEIKYVLQLETILSFFMNPVKDKNLLHSDDFDILFGNISTIYNINKELLDELNKGENNVVKAFSKIAPFLKLYSVYAYDFKKCIHFLQNARSTNPQFSKFLEMQETRPEVQNKLSALLITPIQRVPRYKLLLTQLYNFSSPSESDYQTLIDSLNKIQDAAEHINKILDDHENMQRLLELQRCLRSGEPNVITPGRKLKKEGILLKLSPKSHHIERHYVVLMNDIIMFNKMKKSEPKVNSLKCVSIFPLNKCKVIEILDKGSFRIICQDEDLVFYHEQLCETKEWISEIQAAIEKYIVDRRTLKKECSSRRPVKRKDLHEYHEVGISPGRPLKKRRPLSYGPEETSLNNFRLMARKSIHTATVTSSSDSSLPSMYFPTTVIDDLNQNSAYSNGLKPTALNTLDIYKNKPESSTFKLGNIFTGVSSKIKSLFGFRNN